LADVRNIRDQFIGSCLQYPRGHQGTSAALVSGRLIESLFLRRLIGAASCVPGAIGPSAGPC
jgi:hypothetical protein